MATVNAQNISPASKLTAGTLKYGPYNGLFAGQLGLEQSSVVYYDIGIAGCEADAAGVCALQTTSGAVDMLLNGTFNFGGAVYVTPARNVSVTSASDESSVTFTVYGVDPLGNVISEAITGPNATTVYGSKMFASITRVAASATVSNNTSVGLTNGAPMAADLAGICALQTRSGSGALIINGTAAHTTSLAQLLSPRNISITSTGNISAVTFTVTGKDIYGVTMSEAITGPNNTTVYGAKAFYQITAVSASGSVSTNTRLGWGSVHGLPLRAITQSNLMVWDTSTNNATPLNASQTVTAFLAAVGTAETTYVTSPIAGYITHMSGVSDAANASASSTVTVSIGTVAVGTIVFTSSYSSAGVTVASSALARHSIASGGSIKVVTDGTGDGAGKAVITIRVSPALLTTAVDTTATTTTGDTRGTLEFSDTMTGARKVGVVYLNVDRSPSDVTKVFGVTQA